MGEMTAVKPRVDPSAQTGAAAATVWRDVAPGVQWRGVGPVAAASWPPPPAVPGADPGGFSPVGGGDRGGARRLGRVLAVAAGAAGLLTCLGAVLLPPPAAVTGAPPGLARPSGISPEPLAEAAGHVDAAPTASGATHPAGGEQPAPPSETPAPLEAWGTALDAVSPVDGLGGSEPATDWWSIVEVLDARRLRTLTERDPDGLSGYLVPGSPAWNADSGLIAELRGHGLRPVGMATHLVAIEGVEVASVGEALSGWPSPEEPGDGSDGRGSDGRGSDGAGAATEQAMVVLVDQRSAYTLVDAEGAVVHSVASPGSRRWQVRLVRVPDAAPGEPPHPDSESPSPGSGSPESLLEGHGGDAGWRIAEVTPIP